MIHEYEVNNCLLAQNVITHKSSNIDILALES